MNEPERKDGFGLHAPETSNRRHKEMATGNASDGDEDNRADPQSLAGDIEAPSSNRAPPNEHDKKPPGTVSGTCEAVSDDRTPSKQTEHKPLGYRRVPSVSPEAFVLLPLDVNCREEYPPGTVVQVRQLEYSVIPDAPLEARSEITDTDVYEFTLDAMTYASVSRPAVVIHSFHNVFQAIPVRKNDGKGIYQIKPDNQVEHLLLEAEGENLDKELNVSPHDSIKFIKSNNPESPYQDREWGGNSYLNVTDIFTSHPVSTVKVLGYLCPGEVARMNALAEALAGRVEPPSNAGLDTKSIILYRLDFEKD